MAEASTVTLESSPSDVLKSLNPAQKKEWRISGKLPEIPETPPKEAKTDAESSPAAKTEIAEKTEKPSETVVVPVATKEESRPKGAEARIKELLADNKRLAAEAEELRKRPAITPAKIEEVAKPRRNDVDSKTGQAVYATDEDFQAALEKHLSATIRAEVQRDIAKSQAAARMAEQNAITQKRWQNSLKIATEHNPDWAKVVEVDEKGNFQNAGLKAIKTNGVLDAWILDSEIGADMLYHLAKNPDEIERIQSLGPFAAARELTKLEEKLSGTSAPPKEVKAEDPPKPQVTGAPAPAASISGKATAPVDELQAAIQAEDFRRFQRVANAEDFAKRKKG